MSTNYRVVGNTSRVELEFFLLLVFDLEQLECSIWKLLHPTNWDGFAGGSSFRVNHRRYPQTVGTSNRDDITSLGLYDIFG